MTPKNIFAILILLISGIFFYTFVWEFKAMAVDNVSAELGKLQGAYERATQQLSLKSLRLKKATLGQEQLELLQNFIPQELHSGRFVYNLGQLANQNRLTLKGLQYTIIDSGTNMKEKTQKRLMVEFNMDGRYEDFITWLQTIEKSNTLIDIESIRGAKNSNTSEVISFYIKFYAYGLDIN